MDPQPGLRRLPEACPYCGRPCVVSGGVAVCVAGPSLCAPGYQAMRDLTRQVNAVKAKVSRGRARPPWARRRWPAKRK